MTIITTPSYNEYPHTQTIDTRWQDNDIYGHINNVTYYAYFDSIVNQYLIEAGLDIHKGSTIAFVVNSQCDYFKAAAYPDTLEIGLAAEHLGNSSVRYRLSVFKDGGKTLCASGHFTHVFVSRESRAPSSIPDSIRQALENIQLKPTQLVK